MLSGGEKAAFYEAEMKKFNRESGWKAPFFPNQLEEGETLKIYVLVLFTKLVVP